MIVTSYHLRTIRTHHARPGYCLPLARNWCLEHAIDWRDFLRIGIDSERLLATNDAFALALVEHAHAQAEIRHGQ